MADSNAVRQQRKRRHAAGDHTLCLPSRCPALGAPRTPRAGDVSALERAVREEFGEVDALSLQLALRLVALAEGPGVGGVQAVRALGELAAAQREDGR
jgi:hypothetical protein